MAGALGRNQAPGRRRLQGVYKSATISLFLLSLAGIFWVAYLGGARSTQAEINGIVMSSASVAPNSVNSLAEQLRIKQAQLTEREKGLAADEGQLTAMVVNNQRNILLYLFAAAGALFFLIVLNFYFDYKRNTAQRL